jgi:hypothetical protein
VDFALERTKKTPEVRERIKVFEKFAEEISAANRQFKRRTKATCFNRPGPVRTAPEKTPDDLAARERWRIKKQQQREREEKRQTAAAPMLFAVAATRKQQEPPACNSPKPHGAKSIAEPQFRRDASGSDWRTLLRAQQRRSSQ